VSISHQVVEQAAREVLETSACAKVLGAKHSSDADGNFAELIGTISMLGSMGGTLVLCCSWLQAVEITTGMLGGGPEPDRETVHDALGEMVNQIGGTIKRKIAATGSELLLSPPVVISGSPLKHCVKSTEKPVTVDVELGAGGLSVSLWPS
jgi:CheY-specific phosphatase CheX